MTIRHHIKFVTAAMRHLAETSAHRMAAPRALLDFSNATDDPLEAYYRSRGNPFILRMPADKCYNIGFPGACPNNPFVTTLKAYGQGLCPRYQGSPLHHFYEFWQPVDRSVDTGSRSYPWHDRYLREDQRIAARVKTWEFKRIRHRLGHDTADLSGHFGHGPVSVAMGEITFARFTQIYDSIRRKGLRPFRAGRRNIVGSILVRGNDYRALIGSGKHRAAALLALEYERIPVQFGPSRFPAIVRREDAASWPTVRDGHYTEREAITLFDHIFSDTHPSNWTWPPPKDQA